MNKNKDVNDEIAAGETICAVLKRGDGTTEVIEGKTPEQVYDEAIATAKAAAAALPDRYEISLTIRDRLTGEVRKYEVKE